MDKIGVNRAHPPPSVRGGRSFQFRPPPPRSADQPPSSPWTFNGSSSSGGGCVVGVGGGDRNVCNSTPYNFSDGFLPIKKRVQRGLFLPPAAQTNTTAAPIASTNLNGEVILLTLT